MIENNTFSKRYYNADGELITINANIAKNEMGETVISYKCNTNNFYLHPEDAVDFGNSCINLGVDAGRINSAEDAIVISKDTFRKYLEEGRIEKVIFEKLGDDPKNENYMKFKITPVWKRLLVPDPDMDYYFYDYFYFSKFHQEFDKQLSFYGGSQMIEFVNFDYNEYIKEAIDDMK